MIDTRTGVSVIICCYNSEARIVPTLQHLAAQRTPIDLPWEIVLVDNASTDNTGSFAAGIWQSLGAPASLHVVQEAEPGQQQARKKGVATARYDCIIFCDDDNWLAKDYVAVAYEVMNSIDNIGAAGGSNEPTSDADTWPDWFDSYRDKYALGTPASATGDISHRGFILGAGLITRRHLFQEMYHPRYPSLLGGRQGATLSTGDDFEYCKRLLLRGHQLYYDERLSLQHFIPQERLTIPYREQLMDGIGQAGIVLQEYDHALRFYRRNYHKNRWRLMALTPLRIVLSRWKLINRLLEEEQQTLFYTTPLSWNPHPIRTPIKRFLYRL
ncbi:glycosyltransferase [Paraflavitalea pollutisoli]|uniref:glycosyltransferase n=1 Tax=Paraflavitalea pollutisoli TaxID=3034143 RepID=UPI0023EB19F2|nr:glycosyltransferase [Paraflavitalea sp. H1-2-19X]